MTDKEMAKQFADDINGFEPTCSLLSAKDRSHAYRLGRYDGFLAGLKAGKEIKRENEKSIYLFNRFDVVSAIAHAIYYTANPESEMCIPNCAYERTEKEFDDWFNDTRS